MTRILRFAVTGALGFVVDAGILVLLLALTPLGPILARLISVSIAMVVTWLINRYVTFHPSERGALREGARYGGVGLASSLVNYAVYSGLLLLIPSLLPLAALVIATALSMIFSYLGYSRLVFDR